MNSQKGFWFFLAAVILLALVVFRVVLAPGAVLFTTDDNAGALAATREPMPASFLGHWDDTVLAGMPQLLRVGLTTIILWLLPVRWTVNWIHAIHMALGSVFLMLFLRSKKMSWAACAVAALTAFWLGSNLTLTYAGHIWKYGVLAFAAMFLWTCERALQTRHWPWYLLAGGALGLMFLEQPDVALFFAIILVPYPFCMLLVRDGLKTKALLGFGFPMLALALVLAFNPLWTGYQLNVKGITSVSQETPEQKWNFVTQWSWPPEECIDFVAMGFMGWRSGEADGPYYGRMGRQAGWEKTGQGFRNFKLENQYIGAIPIVLAVLAGLLAWQSRRQKALWQREVAFWSVMTLLSLLLAFGKYFPLYRIFYMLPMVSTVRNPNKFLQVFQISLGILAAYGVDALTRRLAEVKEAALQSAALKWFSGITASIGGLLLAWGLLTSASFAGQLGRFAEWGVVAEAIVNNRIRGLSMGGGLFLAAAALVWGVRWCLLNRQMVLARSVIWIAVALMIVDVVRLGDHYITTLPPSFLADNALVKFMRDAQARDRQRAALISQDGFYNAWLTYLFPYQGVKLINVTAMPRMPADYDRFLKVVSQQPLRYWELMAAPLILGPAQIINQIQADPRFQGRFELAFAWNVAMDGAGGVQVLPASREQPGQHAVIRMRAACPRYAFIGGWSQMDDESALQRLSQPAYDPFAQVILPPDAAAPGFVSQPGLAGRVEIKEYRPGRVRLQVSADRAGILRSAERYDPNWVARVDGKRMPVSRCDYLFQGVPLESGLHDVILQYAPSKMPFLVQSAGMLFMLVGAVAAVRCRQDRGG